MTSLPAPVDPYLPLLGSTPSGPSLLPTLKGVVSPWPEEQVETSIDRYNEIRSVYFAVPELKRGTFPFLTLNHWRGVLEKVESDLVPLSLQGVQNVLPDSQGRPEVRPCYLLPDQRRPVTV